MGHIELRDFDDDDLDAVFEMMRAAGSADPAVFTASDPDDRTVFDEWMQHQRTSPDVAVWVVTENGGFAGTAAAFSVDGEREVTYSIARHSQGRGVGTEALKLLVSREGERPLYARVSADAPSRAVLERIGFTEVSRPRAEAPGAGPRGADPRSHEVEARLYVLPPTLE